MNFNFYSKNFIIMILALLVGIFALACGGGSEEPEDADSSAATSAKADADAYAASKKPAPKPAGKTSEVEKSAITQTLEIISPPTAIDVLEGKAQFRTPGAEEWIDVIDAQPIEPGWSVRTLAVSRAVLKFVDGSQLAIKPSTQITIDKFDIVNGGPAQGGQRHARIALDNGDVDFNVIRAESPPNTWVFLTVDGAITIQGTEGSLGRRVNVKQEELSSEEKAKLVINKKNAERKEAGEEPLSTEQEAALTIEVKEFEGDDLSDEEVEFMEEFVDDEAIAALDAEELEILDEENKLEIETDFKVELLEGTATMVKMGQEAPKPVTPTDADDITGGTGLAPGDIGGPPLGWIPTDGPFLPVGDKGESSLDAAVVKPGVAYEKAETKDVMPPQAPPAGAEGAAAAIPDIDGDGEFGPADIIMMKDVAFVADLGVDVGDVVPDPNGLITAAEEAGVADVNATVELAALAGPEAVDAIVEGGDIESAVAVAEELFSDVAVVVNDTMADAEGAATEIFNEFEPEIKTLTEDQADPAILEELIASGEIDIAVEPLVMAADIDAVSGERLDLEALRELRKAEFEPPRSEPLFDEEGNQIGVKQPDQVVFDATGNPIGKKPGDMVAVDENGAIDTEAAVPDVFYLKDKAGDDKLHATTFFNAFLPKVPTGSEIGGAGEQALNMVTFDPDGNIVPTIIQYDPLGNPVGTLPFSDDFVDPSGDALTPPDLPIFDYNADGTIATQVEMPMIVKDATGGIREFNVPPPIVFDENGAPMGMSEPPKLMVGDAGVSGFEAGRVLSKDFFSEQAALIEDSFATMPMEGPAAGGGMGVGGFGAPLGFIPSGAMDKIAKYAAPGTGMPGPMAGGPGFGAPTTAMYDFDKYDLSNDTASFFDAGGTQRTGDEFRMQEIYRDSATGEVAGFQPITEVMCITQDCFRDASQSDAVLAKIEEKVEVLSFDDDGRAVIAEIGGQTLFTEDGHLAGFIPPPIVMGGPMGMGMPG
ncbi:MAG: hypothetical protein VX523_03705, partial [Chloroflexota bacterium]|nr:hypothetical protein [Chloroflexota bacterium]